MIKPRKAPKYFTISELCRSTTALRYGVQNTPSPVELERLTSLVTELLDPVRELWGEAIYVNSGFRSAELNQLVGGVPTSQHRRGEAVDITTGSVAKNRALFEMIKRSGLRFDQLIDERQYSWLHISYSHRNRGHIIHL